MQFNSPLFSLPHEIRDRIYGFYLTPNNGDFENALRPHNMFLGGAVYSRTIPVLMRTCKRAHREMYAAVHQQALMRVEMPDHAERRIGFAVHGTLRFGRLRKLWLLIPMEHPNWNCWLHFFGDVVHHTPGLEVLVVDWSPRPITAGGWTGRINLKKEDEFLQMIKGLKQLHTVWLHGNIPPRWGEQLRRANLRVNHSPTRWWREHGWDP
ncbi:hypothetical protein GGR55DRAFT_456533 [Xylaria sp. FL0064]|nr:hypothetical protein GGR55DRAFT_456533 [Xylaria sp. FL0064]